VHCQVDADSAQMLWRTSPVLELVQLQGRGGADVVEALGEDLFINKCTATCVLLWGVTTASVGLHTFVDRLAQLDLVNVELPETEQFGRWPWVTPETKPKPSCGVLSVGSWNTPSLCVARKARRVVDLLRAVTVEHTLTLFVHSLWADEDLFDLVDAAMHTGTPALTLAVRKSHKMAVGVVLALQALLDHAALRLRHVRVAFADTVWFEAGRLPATLHVAAQNLVSSKRVRFVTLELVPCGACEPTLDPKRAAQRWPIRGGCPTFHAPRWRPANFDPGASDDERAPRPFHPRSVLFHHVPVHVLS